METVKTYDFDQLKRGVQYDKLLTVKSMATADPSILKDYMKAYDITESDIYSILASRKLWNGYNFFNSLLRPEKGCACISKKVQEWKSKIENILTHL